MAVILNSSNMIMPETLKTKNDFLSFKEVGEFFLIKRKC